MSKYSVAEKLNENIILYIMRRKNVPVKLVGIERDKILGVTKWNKKKQK